MVRYERYTVKIKCPKCAENGQKTLEEPENPVWHGNHARVVSVTGNFKIKSEKITCGNCGSDVQ